MKKLNAAFYIIFFLTFLSVFTKAQKITVTLKSGKQITGYLIYLNSKEVDLNPGGNVSYLALPSNQVSSVSFDELNKVFNYPITDEDIPAEFKNKRKKVNTENYSYYKNYYEMSFFGGISSEKTIGYVPVPSLSKDIPFIYQGNGLGGLGFSYMHHSKFNNPDFSFDLEMGFISFNIMTAVNGQKVEALTGGALCTDAHFNLYLYNCRNPKLPCFFIFGGVGLRFTILSNENYNINAEEDHTALLFGPGVRWQITDGFALQLKERFVNSSFENIGSFIIPETQLEIYFVLDKD